MVKYPKSKWDEMGKTHYYEPREIDEGLEDGLPHGGGGGTGQDRHGRNESLLAWWQKQMEGAGEREKYPCYGFVLAVKSDREMINFLNNNGIVLHQLSGKYCLIMSLVGKRLNRSGVDKGWVYPGRRAQGNHIYDQKLMKAAIEHGLDKGYALPVAHFFSIERRKLPCLVLFTDPEKKERAVISFKNRTERQIAETLKTVFDALEKAVDNGKEPLRSIETRMFIENVEEKGKGVIVGIGLSTFVEVAKWLFSLQAPKG